MKEALKIVCKGPLQSWGSDDCSWTDLRKTDLYPSKSGIVGMISCAFGFTKNSPKIKELSDSITLYLDKRTAVIGEILEDFQIIGSAGQIPTANCSRKMSPIVRKQYLNGAYFELYISGNHKILEDIANALDHPYWPYYLGRKCCVPSKKVNHGLVEIEEGELACIYR